MRTLLLRILPGMLVSVIVMAGLSGLFFFLNPLSIHEVNRLRWVPILITGVGLSVASRLNPENAPALAACTFIADCALEALPIFVHPVCLFPGCCRCAGYPGEPE